MWKFANIKTAPRRLPQWLAPLPTHRTIPAAYVSRYNRNLPTHNLGRCTSVCPFCRALHWPQERVQSSSVARPRFQTCCKEGQVVLNEIPEPPAYLRWLWTSDDRDARDFRSNARQYNRAFAFTSFKYTEDRRLADRGIRGGIQSFSIHGQIYHQTGAALREGAVPRYAQLYFVGSERAVEARTEGNNLNPEIVRRLTELIEQNNPFVEYYHTALRSLQESELEGSLRVVLNPEFRLVVEPSTDRRRYNLPTVDEVAVVIPDGTDRNTRDVILFARNGDGSLSQRFEYIPRNHPAYLPLHYVLFYPLGNPGYHWSIPLQNQRVRGDIDQEEGEQEGERKSCVSTRQFYRYHLFNRQNPDLLTSRLNSLFHGGKLFQQICCDMYACVDDNILNWHRINQSTVRADLYSGVMDALRTDRADQIGDPVILAASYVGGDRFIAKCYQVCTIYNLSTGIC